MSATTTKRPRAEIEQDLAQLLDKLDEAEEFIQQAAEYADDIYSRMDRVEYEPSAFGYEIGQRAKLLAEHLFGPESEFDFSFPRGQVGELRALVQAASSYDRNGGDDA